MLDRVAKAPQTAEVLVEVGGVGYRVLVPAGAIGQLGPPGSSTFLHVHTHVREDAIVLYGFPTREERGCFELLIGAHGVGPAVALALLSVHSPAALQRAVHSDDADALMLVPGIGRKTATRLLVELKSRLDVDFDESDLRVVGGPANGSGASPDSCLDPHRGSPRPGQPGLWRRRDPPCPDEAPFGWNGRRADPPSPARDGGRAVRHLLP